MKACPISYVLTHPNVHLDEIATLWLLTTYMEDQFPGIREAEFVFEGVGGQQIAGLSEDDLIELGYLPLGVGGGDSDEHASTTKEAKTNECTLTLWAEKLGLRNNPELQEIFKYVKHIDTTAGDTPFGLGTLTKSAIGNYPEQISIITRMIFIFLDSKRLDQIRFLDAVEEFLKNAVIEEAQGPRERMIKIAKIKSSGNRDMIRAFRSNEVESKIGPIAVLIQMQNSGHVQIFTNHKQGVKLSNVARLVRSAEQKKKGEIITTDWQELAKEGTVLGAEEWYLHPSLNMLFNGALSAPNVLPTKLSLDEIFDLVRIGVSPK